MKGIGALFLGIFGTFAFSWAGLVLIPNYQIGHLDPQMDEDGNDPYPAPKSGMANRGRQIYAANGCVYCHSQQMRADYAAPDLERTRDGDVKNKPKWGERRSAPRDYLFERPVLLGRARLGPDLANIGKAAPAEEESAAPATSPAAPATPQASPTGSAPPAASPGVSPAKAVAATSPAAAAASPAATASTAPAASASPSGPTVAAANGVPPPYTAAWHHRHLYSPRSVVLDTNMPAYRFLYEKRRISGERAADAVQLGEGDAVPEGWEVVPTYEARCLVAYLMSLDQSHALNELKATAAAAPTSPAPAPVKEAK